MKNDKRLGLVLPVIAVVAASLALGVFGCSGDVAEPTNAEAQTFSSNVADDSGAFAMGRRAEELTAFGISLDGVDGVFDIGWREFFNRRENSVEIAGGAHAVGFAAPFVVGAGTNKTVDMGAVKLIAPDGEHEMIKHTGRGDQIRYSTMQRPARGETPTRVPFSGGATYTFDAGGSDDFAAVSLDVVAPAQLMEITNLERGDQIDPRQDLEVEWTGGSEGRVMVMVFAHKAPPEGRGGRRGDGPPGPRGRHEGQRGRHGGPPPLDEGQVYREVLETNAGQFVVPAQKLGELLSASGGDRLGVQVLQLTGNRVEADGRALLAMLRNGAGVRLTVK